MSAFSGRVLNRFSKDVGHMDDLLPITFFDFVQVPQDFLIVKSLVNELHLATKPVFGVSDQV